MSTVCPMYYMTVDPNLNKPELEPLEKIQRVSIGTDLLSSLGQVIPIHGLVLSDRPEVKGVISTERPDIPSYNVDVRVDVPSMIIHDRRVSVHSPESVEIPEYRGEDTPTAPSDPSNPPDVAVASFNIPVEDISVVYNDVLAQLDLDVPVPEEINISIPDPPVINIADPSNIPVIPLIEATIVLSDLPPSNLEIILGKPRVTPYKLFSIIDDDIYSEMLRIRDKLMNFLNNLLDQVGVDVSKLAGYFDAIVNLFSTAYQKIVSLRNKGNELEYWTAHFRLQADTFSRQYRIAVETFRNKVRVYKASLDQIRDYYGAIRDAYSIGASVFNAYIGMAKSTISDANRLINRVTSINNDIASAYTLHTNLVMRLLRKDVLEAELYRLQAEKAVQLYRLMELSSLEDVAEAEREALLARYNALVARFNAVREEADVLSKIVKADNKKLEALKARLEGDVAELSGIATRLSSMEYIADQMYADQLIRLAGLYRDRVSNFLRQLREYYDLTNRKDILNQTFVDNLEIANATMQTRVDITHSELQADVTRAYLHEQGIIKAARIMSDARIASTIIEMYQ